MNRDKQLPNPLKQGDTLGIIAPAGQLHDKNKFEDGIKVLKEMDFKVKFARDLWPGESYLADNDYNRAKEINHFFADPNVQGLVAVRGGFGCLRLLDKIDLKVIAQNPKPLVGFSDITILQNYLFEKLGQISFHGPVLTSLANVDEKSRHSFFSCLHGTWQNHFSQIQLEILRDGPTVRGPLVGGNLASLVTLLGTEYELSWEGKIVFLEDVNEPVYKIDRMLTQLQLAGKFNGVLGLILGNFSMAATEENLATLRFKESVWNRVLEITDKSALPVWGDFPSGHCSHNLTFPIGANVMMSNNKGRLLPV